MRITKLKKTSLLTLSGLLMCQNIFADDATGFLRGSYPYIAPENCQMQVVHPEGANGLYRSFDCKTLYVLPPKEGTAKIRSFAPSMNMLECNRFQKNADMVSKFSDLIEKYQTRLDELSPASGEAQRLLAEIEKIMILRDKLQVIYDDVEGATAQIVFSTSATQDFLNQYILKNIELVRQRGIAFEHAPISESYISFTAKQIDPAVKTRGNAVLSTSIPGITITKEGLLKGPVVMNGAISGQIVLGLSGVCGLVDAKQVRSLEQIRNIKVEDERLNAYLTANLTYRIPMRTVAGYRARLDVSNFAEGIFKFMQEKTKFTAKEISDFFTTSNVKDAFTFIQDGYEMPDGSVSEEARVDFYGRLREEVRSRLAQRLSDHLTQMGMLKVDEPETLKAPEAGTVSEVYFQRVCRREKFLFVDLGETCNNIPYTVTRNVSGSSDQFVKKLVDARFELTENVSVNAIIYRTHTTAFTFQSKIQ